MAFDLLLSSDHNRVVIPQLPAAQIGLLIPLAEKLGYNVLVLNERTVLTEEQKELGYLVFGILASYYSELKDEIHANRQA